MQIEYVPIDSIKPYERNAKKHPDEQVKHIANSIREFGWQQPIVVDKDGVVVIGHGRLLAAKKLGYDEVPIVRAESLSEEQVKALRLADNKTNESEWEEALLKLELLNIEDIDMLQFGFDGTESESEKKEDAKKKVEEMQIKAFEHYDYIVFFFKNSFDWINIVNEFGLKKVNAGYGETKKIGLGRVIDGTRLLEKLGHSSIDIE